MNWLETNLLEDPTKVCVALAFAMLALAAIWYETRSRRVALLMVLPPALAGIVLAVASLVVTDREQITAAARYVARCIETGQTDRIAGRLADDFMASLHGKTLRKPDVKDVADVHRGQYKITRIQFRGMTVELAGGLADMRVVTVVHGGWEGLAGGRAIAWQLRWAKTPQGWRIVRVEEPLMDVEP